MTYLFQTEGERYLGVTLFSNEKNLIETAKKNGIDVIEATEIEALAKDNKRLNTLLGRDLMAQASLMPQVARYLGQYLGPRNKMPKPVMPGANLDNMVKALTKSVSIKSKGKYLPTVHSVAGTEDMEPAKIYDNIKEIIRVVGAKVGQNNIKSVYIKLTMSKPMKFI